MEEKAFDDVVTSLYRAASGLEAWPAIMRKMSDAIGAWGIQLVGLDKADGTLLFSHEGGTAPPESALDVAVHDRLVPADGPPRAHPR